MKFQSFKNIISVILFFFLLQLPLFLFSSEDSSISVESHVIKGNAFLESLKYDSAEFHFAQVLPVLKEQCNWDYYCSIANKYTTTLWQQLKLREAEDHARQTLEDCYNMLGPDHPETAESYINLGAILFINQSKSVALNYFEKARSITERQLGLFHPKTAEVYGWLGTVHESVSDTNKAFYFLNKSLMVWKEVKGINHCDLGNIYRYLGLYYKRFLNFDSSYYCFRKAKTLFDKRYGYNNFQSVKCLNNLGDLFQSWSITDSAMHYSRQALKLMNHLPCSNIMAGMMTHLYFSELYFDIGYPEKSLSSLQQALYLFSGGTEKGNHLSNPEFPADHADYYYTNVLKYKSELIDILAESDTSHRLDYYFAERDCFNNIQHILANKEMMIHNYEDYLAYININAEFLYKMVKKSLSFYKYSGNEIFINDALKHIESGRKASHILSNKIFYRNISHVDQTSSILLESIDHKIFALKDKLLATDNDSLSKQINECILDKKIEKDNLCWKLRKRFIKDTLSIDDQNVAITLNSIRAYLKSDQALLIYLEQYPDYISEPIELTGLIITDDTVSFFNTAEESTFSNIMDFVRSLSLQESSEETDLYGGRVYSHILMPFESIIEGKSLIIMPSHMISLVPFDALPVFDSVTGKKEFLINRNLTWKIFSLTDFIDYQDVNKRSHRGVLLMAPSFNSKMKFEIARMTNRDTSLMNLAGARKECIEIGNLMKSRPYIGVNAMESIFKELAPHSNIIHLSTHGILDKQSLQTVRLAFNTANDPGEDGYLNLFEILDMDLVCDLIVLGACKTGIGEFNKGEGNLNLAWAFRQSGVRSSVISLWDANDYASSVIMPGFYKNLAEGNTKPEALRKAKLDFIKSSDDLTGNPYFWAGFEYYGNDTEILVQNKKVPVLLLIGVLCVVMVLVVVVFTKFKYY